MKKFTYLIAAAALCTACSTGNKSYTINGTAESVADGDTVYLVKPQGRQLVKLDSAMVANGAFTFKGVQDTAAVRYITNKSPENSTFGVEFFLENGNIALNLSEENASATGTANNDIYQGIRQQLNDLNKQAMDIYKAALSDSTLTEEQQKAKMAEVEALMDKSNDIKKEAIKQNIANPVGIYLLKQSYYYMTVEELDPLMPQIPTAFDNDEAVTRIKENVEKMKATAVGQKFTDFAMKTPEGKDVKLSDYVGKGKVVLVDFWASWCGPCRREMPNLVEAYAKYKNKNFEIVGVSLDQNAEAWKAAIKQLNITWPQMSDLKYWNCEGAKLYAVSSIPHTVLIDGDGTILARELHGEEMLDKLAEVLK